jgi:hydrogenase maturation protease
VSAAGDIRPGRIAVLGVGNVLLGDDGLGPYAVRVLNAEYALSEAVEVLDVGTPGLDFTPYLADADAVIVIDTVKSDAPPGTIKLYDREQLLAAPPLPRTSPHEPGLREALLATELTDCSPERLLLVGVVPESTASMPGLTPVVRAAVPGVLSQVIAELERLGASVERRATPRDPEIWWEKEPGD